MVQGLISRIENKENDFNKEEIKNEKINSVQNLKKRKKGEKKAEDPLSVLLANDKPDLNKKSQEYSSAADVSDINSNLYVI